jgi:Zn finger protein HypA/HybF involved in hydrogenase expression
MFKQCEKCGKTVFGINERLTKLGGHLYCPTCREIRIGKGSYLSGIACLSCHAGKVVRGGSVFGSSGVLLIIFSLVCIAAGAFAGAGFVILGVVGLVVAVLRRKEVLRCTQCKSVFTTFDVLEARPIDGLSCPLCKSSDVARDGKKFTVGGWIALIIGLFTIYPIVVGLFLIAWAFDKREPRFRCRNCQRSF